MFIGTKICDIRELLVLVVDTESVLLVPPGALVYMYICITW